MAAHFENDRELTSCSGAEIVFQSFLAPTLGRYFEGSAGSTASGIRSKAETTFSKSD